MIGWNFTTLSHICDEAEKRGVSAVEYAADLGFDDLEGLHFLSIRDRLRGIQADAAKASTERAREGILRFARAQDEERGRFLDSIERGGVRR